MGDVDLAIQVAAQHEPYQFEGGRRVQPQRPVGQPGVGCGRIVANALDLFPNEGQLPAKGFLGIVRVLALQECDPAGVGNVLQVFAVHGPEVDVDELVHVTVGAPVVPTGFAGFPFLPEELAVDGLEDGRLGLGSLDPVVVRNLKLAVHHLLLAVDVGHLTAQDVHVFLVPRDHQGVPESGPHPLGHNVPMRHHLVLGRPGREVPAIGPAEPLAPGLSSDTAVQTDV